MNTNFINQLKDLVDSSVDTVLFPVKTGNKINIGSYSIKQSRGTFSIKCYKSKDIVAQTYTKAAAIAIAKSLAKNKQSVTVNIIELDKIAAKHGNDCIFYRHTLKKTTNQIIRDTTLNRFDISIQKQQDAIDKIKQYIL